MKNLQKLMIRALSFLSFGKAAFKNKEKKTVEHKVKMIVAKQLGLAIDDISDEDSIMGGSLMADDVDLIEIIMKLEDTFHMTINHDDIIGNKKKNEPVKNIRVNDLIGIVKKSLHSNQEESS